MQVISMMSENSTREIAEHAIKEGRAFLQAQDNEQALKSFQCAADICGRLKDRKGQADALNMVGGILARMDRADEAIAVFSQVTDLLREEPLSRARGMAWSNRGLILARQERFREALRCFEEALIVFDQSDELIRVAEQCGNIGTVCRDLELPDRAIENYQRALAIYRKLDLKERIGDQLTNIGYARLMQQSSADALRWYREGLSHYMAAGCESKLRSIQENIDSLEAALGINRCSTC